MEPPGRCRLELPIDSLGCGSWTRTKASRAEEKVKKGKCKGRKNKVINKCFIFFTYHEELFY